MSGDRTSVDPGAEREIDLRPLLDVARTYWWLALAGLVAGLVVGGVITLGGSTSYQANALIARGQAFNPAGTSAVLSYVSSPAAIQNLATSPATLDAVSAETGISVAELRGHLSTATLTDTGTASTTNTGSLLIQIAAVLPKPKKAEDAANALAVLIQKATTSNYVRQSIRLYQVRLNNYAVRVKTLNERIKALNDALASSNGLQPLDRLVLVSQLDSTEANLGQTLDSQTTTEQQLTLAQIVETTQLVQKAKAEKLPVRSRRNSVLFGGLIGLILGALAALVYGLRFAGPRSRT